MRIAALTIRNFRAIQALALSHLPNAVVLAGPNGCGKSSVLDAIRLLKSAYGQYRENEYQQWFSEFQIDVKDLSRDAHQVLQDPLNSLHIHADIVLSESEKLFLREKGPSLARRLTWDRVLPRTNGPPMLQSSFVSPTDDRVYGESVKRSTEQMLQSLPDELASRVLRAELTMDSAGEVTVRTSTALELIFSTYQPAQLGIIDYHGPNRSYGREKLSNVNLNVVEDDRRSRQSALYDTQNKYANIKTEMASAFIRELLADKAGISKSDRSSILETLKQLFEVFFPGKRFAGPQPTVNGALTFPVELENGARHDIDELSSGEKEVLLGYLRLRNSAPSNSVILLDEPELHLNPRLIRGLPKFYQKHLGEALGNQIWLVTHSDTLLREAVDEPQFAVFHMQSVSPSGVDNQAYRVSASEQLERAVIDLVGDLASYSPHARIVLLEGGGDSKVDLHVLRQLFPEFTERVNLISSGSKGRVRELHSLLEQATVDGSFRARFFSIVDRDFDPEAAESLSNRFSWGVYHIENYLLHPKSIRSVMENLASDGNVPSEAAIEEELLHSARDTINGLVRIRMEQRVNSELVSCIITKGDPRRANIAGDLHAAVERSMDRAQAKLIGALTLEALEIEELCLRNSLNQTLIDGSWMCECRGRDVLKRFISRMRLGLQYERFRNLVVSTMRLDGYKPPGMKEVLDAILLS